MPTAIAIILIRNKFDYIHLYDSNSDSDKVYSTEIDTGTISDLHKFS